MTRRRLLRLSLLGGLTLSGGLLVGRLLSGGYPRAAGARCLSDKEYSVLSAAALRLLDGAGPPVEVALWVDAYVSRMDPSIQDDFRGLLQVLEHSPTLSGYRSRFTALAPADQDRVLEGWRQSRIDLRRQGFQALKSLCCLAYYQDPRSFSAIGYSGPMVP